MSYLVIARKFRPQTFESIAGQQHITRALSNAILRDKVPHAFLFTGPRGVGKTTSARVIARALNCTGREVIKSGGELSEEEARVLIEPCGNCTNCQEIARSASVAVWEIDGASNNSVENVRELIDSLRTLPPPGSQYKIYIIDEVHMLSVAAFNALLKSLEEPPPNTIFIFATTEPHKIPETVISRCQRHDFRRLSPQVIAERLREIAGAEGIDVEDQVFQFISRRVQGGMRDAQSMFDRLIAFSYEKIDLATAQTVFGVLDSSYFFKQSEAVFKQDPQTCFELLDQAFTQSIDLRAFIADFVTHWRNLMLLSVSLEKAKESSETSLRRMLELSKDGFQQYRAQLEAQGSYDLQRLFDIAEKAAHQALHSNFPRYVLEAGLAKMAALPSLRPLPELISKLEKGVGGGGSLGSALAKVPREESSPLQSVASQKEEVVLAPETETLVPDEATEHAAAPVVASFDPSWQGFLAHVRGRNELLLEAVLRRVSAKSFERGRIAIEAGDFDLETLRHIDTRKSLENCLYSYSGHESWSVDLQPHQGGAPVSENKEGSLGAHGNGTNGNGVSKKITSAVVPGSVAAIEGQKRAKRKVEKEREAQSDPLVKAALGTFKGSKIEKIAILD